MIATGTVFILLALVELVLSTFSLYTTDKPFEEVTALLIFGFTVLWFSTPEQDAARTLTAPRPGAMNDYQGTKPQGITQEDSRSEQVDPNR